MDLLVHGLKELFNTIHLKYKQHKVKPTRTKVTTQIFQNHLKALKQKSNYTLIEIGNSKEFLIKKIDSSLDTEDESDNIDYTIKFYYDAQNVIFVFIIIAALVILIHTKVNSANIYICLIFT